MAEHDDSKDINNNNNPTENNCHVINNFIPGRDLKSGLDDDLNDLVNDAYWRRRFGEEIDSDDDLFSLPDVSSFTSPTSPPTEWLPVRPPSPYPRNVTVPSEEDEEDFDWIDSDPELKKQLFYDYCNANASAASTTSPRTNWFE